MLLIDLDKVRGTPRRVFEFLEAVVCWTTALLSILGWERVARHDPTYALGHFASDPMLAVVAIALLKFLRGWSSPFLGDGRPPFFQ